MHMMVKCPSCDTKVLATAEKCPACGALIKPYAKDEPTPADAPFPQYNKRKRLYAIAIALLIIFTAAAVLYFFAFGGADSPERAMERVFAAISAKNWDKAVELAAADVRDNPAKSNAAKNRLASAFRDMAPHGYEIISTTLQPEKNTASVKVRFTFMDKTVSMEETFNFTAEGASWRWIP
jgi:uncharacterized protein YchJ/rRNA maturation protein Nop10